MSSTQRELMQKEFWNQSKTSLDVQKLNNRFTVILKPTKAFSVRAFISVFGFS